MHAETRNAARRLLKSRLRLALFVSRLGEDSTAAQVEEGISEEAQAAWVTALAAWDLPAARSQVIRLIEEAFQMATDDTLSLFADDLGNDDWEKIVTAFRAHFKPTDLLPERVPC